MLPTFARPPVTKVGPVHFAAGVDGRVLVLSMREVAALVGYTAMYEFEDVVTAMTGADVGTVSDVEGLEWRRRIFKLARYATGSSHIAHAIGRMARRIPSDKTYDLFISVFNHPYELFALQTLGDWRSRCRFAACYICEAWNTELPVYLIELLAKFDHVFVGVNVTVDAIAAISRRPCSYLPMGVDALAFCPFPGLPARSIDVCGIGRRSPETHAALLEWAKTTNRFYYYDTVQMRWPHGGPANRPLTFRVIEPREHRTLYANILKRSRYFIANRALADKPSLTRGTHEIAARFYEGAAAGAIMLGEPPDSMDFRSQFDWPDAIIRAPFHSPNIADVIVELEADPARCARIRRDSVVKALLKHDWAYRLRSILTVAGMPAPDALLRREDQLRSLAEQVASTGDARAP
jgi:hypothetical protein